MCTPMWVRSKSKVLTPKSHIAMHLKRHVWVTIGQKFSNYFVNFGFEMCVTNYFKGNNLQKAQMNLLSDICLQYEKTNEISSSTRFA